MKNPINDQAENAINYIDSNLETMKKSKVDYEDNTPFLLGENIKHLSLTLNDCIEEENDFFEELRALENHRGHTLSDVFYYIQDKYYQAYRTNKILNIEKSNFILLLQGYETKTLKHELFSVQRTSNFNEINNLIYISELLNKIPIVYIQNPMESGPIKSLFIGKRTKRKNIYRINYGIDWLGKVKILMKYASSIIIDTTNNSTGLDKEIELLKEHNFIEKAFFLKANDKVIKIFKKNDIKFLIEHINTIYRRFEVDFVRNEYLPVAELWIEGNTRNELNNDYIKIINIIKDSDEEGKRFTGAIYLDLFTQLLVIGLQLEDFGKMHFGILNKVLTIMQYKHKDLKNRNKLIYSYLAVLFEIELMFPKTNNDGITFTNNLNQYINGMSFKNKIKRFWCFFKHKLEYLGALRWREMTF